HLAITYDGGFVRLFVNGILTGSTSVSGNIINSTAPLRIGGTSVWGEYFQGLIDEVRVYKRALSQGEIQADMSAPVGGAALPDTTAPTVSIASPSAGTTVKGSTTITASASDNVGVSGVQFLLDGAPLGS